MRAIHTALSWLIPGLYLTFSTALALSNVLMALILIGFVLTFQKSHLSRSAWPVPAFWLMALYAMVLVGMLYTPAPWEWSSLNWGKYTKFVYAVVLMLLLYKRPEWQRRSLLAFELGMLFILASTWLNIWFVLPWSASKQPGWNQPHHVMFDYIVQNVMMGFFVVYALTKMDRRAAHWKNAFYATVALLALVSITHLSQGRTGLVVVASTLLTYLFARLGLRRAVFAIPVTALVLGGLVASSDMLSSRFKQAAHELVNADADRKSSTGHRIYNYKTTPKLIAERPFFGHGTGAYHTEICHVLDDPKDCPTYRWHSHNQFLMFGADHGLVGIGLYIALILSAGSLAWRSKQQKDRLLLFSLLSALVADSLINSALFSAFESHFFLYMLALLVVRCRHQDGQVLEHKELPYR